MAAGYLPPVALGDIRERFRHTMQRMISATPCSMIKLPAIGMTDHGNMFGASEFYNAATTANGAACSNVDCHYRVTTPTTGVVNDGWYNAAALST